MNDWEQQLRTESIAVARFRHGGQTPHSDPPEELATVYSINFVTAGRFPLQFGSKVSELETGCLFVTRPGLEYRTRHCQDFPDDTCTSVVFHPSSTEMDGPLFERQWEQPVHAATPSGKFWSYALARRLA